ncbi:unnamed protein product [Soboliphyme baturini]|uniref:AA_permease domain-containing protein n=1 Tax=Soboliphyme baturini TaxID=241478 RepID=A0A183I9T2_9BILA|nr:unnamed protein product [Soboliphyme baturini]
MSLFCLIIYENCLGDINIIAPIISNFFLASYGLLNYACFDASYAASPGFRPGFKYFNKWLSLGGAMLCIAVMFIMSWWTSLITLVFIACLYMYLYYRQPAVNWGSSVQAHSYKSALDATLALSSTAEHVKNYRPQILLLSGNPITRPSLIDFAAHVTKDNSLLLCAFIMAVSLLASLCNGSDR